jgi:5-methylcytosine-specific restriction protein A
MATYLLTWNPKNWHWADYSQRAAAVGKGRMRQTRWSTGRISLAKRGDRFFLLRQGLEPRGIVGSGEITSEVSEDRHWSIPGARSNYISIRFDRLIDVEAEPDRLMSTDLLRQKVPSLNTNVQGSGTPIADGLATKIERLWNQIAGRPQKVKRTRSESAVAGEVDDPARYYEGATKTVSVLVYERDVRARRRCLEHYGTRCAACHMNFASTYGRSITGCIQVHHRRPLSTINSRYKVDPIRDLIPLCPNCHAVVHRTNPPMTVEVLQALLQRRQPAAR